MQKLCKICGEVIERTTQSERSWNERMLCSGLSCVAYSQTILKYHHNKEKDKLENYCKSKELDMKRVMEYIKNYERKKVQNGAR